MLVLGFYGGVTQLSVMAYHRGLLVMACFGGWWTQNTRWWNYSISSSDLSRDCNIASRKLTVIIMELTL